MIPSFVRGPIANVFTAFHEDGRFDPDGQRNFLDFLMQSGTISAYFVRSGMGQMYTFGYDDVRAMIEVACSHLKGKAPVLVGCAGEWDHNPDRRPDPKVFTQQAIELSRYAESHGAAGVVHTLPEAILPQDGETYADVTLRYFAALNESVNVPIFIYQPPSTAKEYIVTIDLAQQLADFPQIKAMKASTPDSVYMLDICWATRDKDFAYIVGHEGGFYAGLHMGAAAVIGQGCCINPQILLAVQERFEAGDNAGAMDAQRSVNYLVETSVHPVEFFKRYATEKGFPVKPYSRGATFGSAMPKPSLTDAQYEAYKAILEAELARYSTINA